MQFMKVVRFKNDFRDAATLFGKTEVIPLSVKEVLEKICSLYGAKQEKRS